MENSDPNNRFVDIIMPTFNPELPLFRRAIESILNQTHGNWNLFVILDGGDVKLTQLIQMCNDPRIHFQEIPHRGKAAALNVAIAQGTGEYIAYLDDDDVWYPNHLEAALTCLVKNDVRFVYTNAYEILVEKENDGYVNREWSHLSKGVLTETLLWQISHINSVHERTLLNKAGSYDEGRTFFIDWDMFVRMAKISKPFHCQIFTCEHYIYPKREAKEGTISGIHAKNPALSEKAFFEMVARTHEIIDSSDFVRIIHELKWRVDYKEKTGSEYVEGQYLNQCAGQQSDQATNLKTLVQKQSNELAIYEKLIKKQRDNLDISNKQKENLLNSLSWKITKPLRVLGQFIGMPTPLDAAQSRPIILFIAPRLPEFDRASGDLRLFRMLQILNEKYKIYYYNDGIWERFLKQGDKKYLNSLTDSGITVLDSESALYSTLETYSPFAIVSEFYHLGAKYYHNLQKFCPNAHFVIDSVDIHYFRERIMAETLGDEQLRLDAEVTKVNELQAYNLADCTWVVSDLDQDALIKDGMSENKTKIIPNIHTISNSVAPFEERDANTLLFIGGFVHQPNIDAVQYFYTEIFQRVKAKLPSVTLLIVGDSPTEPIRKMAGDDVKVLGFVPDTQPYLNSSTISVAPLRYGAGLKGKVGEALASGLPLVTTSIGAQGMRLESGTHCFIADTPEEFADSIVSLLLNRDLWQTFSANGRSFMDNHYGFGSVKESLLDYFEQLPK